MTPEMQRVVPELEAMVEGYGAAFSSKVPSRVLAYYKPNALLALHQLGADRTGKGGAGRTVRAYTGGLVGALFRGALPAGFLFRIAFRRLAKRGYARSHLRLLGVKSISQTELRMLAHFERFDVSGAIFESSEVVYRLEKIDGSWRICEGWLFDDRDQAASLELHTYEPIASA